MVLGTHAGLKVENLNCHLLLCLLSACCVLDTILTMKTQMLIVFALGSSQLAGQLSRLWETALLSQVSRSLDVAEGTVAQRKAGLKPLDPPPFWLGK